MHLNKNMRKCHYYNNSKTCPFKEVGCKFAHEASNKCNFLDKCKNHLCQFQHDISNGKAEEVTIIFETVKISDTKTVVQVEGTNNLDMKGPPLSKTNTFQFYTAHTVLPLESVVSVLACIMMGESRVTVGIQPLTFTRVPVAQWANGCMITN